MISKVADQQRAVPIEDDAVGLSKLRPDRWSAIATEPGNTCAGNGTDDLCLAVNFTYNVVVGFDDVDVADGIEPELVGHVQGCRGRGPAVASVAAVTGSCHCCHMAG